MAGERCIWVALDKIAFGLIVANGVVVEAPPIFKWMKGRDEEYCAKYLKRRGAHFADVSGWASREGFHGYTGGRDDHGSEG